MTKINMIEQMIQLLITKSKQVIKINKFNSLSWEENWKMLDKSKDKDNKEAKKEWSN